MTDAVRWTSPFCLLLCDALRVRADPAGHALELAEGECAAARIGLARFTAAPSTAAPRVGGREVAPADALDAAARILAAARQPLFGGLGTDVAGARALYPLARDTGAICDPAAGEALMRSVRPLQDRGGYSTTLAEVRNRADLVVWLDGMPDGDAAELLARCDIGTPGSPPRRLVLLGGTPEERAALQALDGQGGLRTQHVPLHGDLFDTVALLAALAARRMPPQAAPALQALADQLLAARYGVLVGRTARLPAHGALIVEAVARLVGTLNAGTRAATLWLGGGNGAGTVNQVFTWLSALPLRTRAGPHGPEHDPVCFDTARLLADGAVDCVLWLSCFDPDCTPPPSALPLIVLGHPGLAPSAAREGDVFMPVSTPGIGSAGHLFRADGGTVLPLSALYRDTLPALPEVLAQLTQRVRGLRAGARA